MWTLLKLNVCLCILQVASQMTKELASDVMEITNLSYGSGNVILAELAAVKFYNDVRFVEHYTSTSDAKVAVFTLGDDLVFAFPGTVTIDVRVISWPGL